MRARLLFLTFKAPSVSSPKLGIDFLQERVATTKMHGLVFVFMILFFFSDFQIPRTVQFLDLE